LRVEIKGLDHRYIIFELLEFNIPLILKVLMIILGKESFKAPQILFSLPDSLPGFFFQCDEFGSGFQKEEEVGEF
jgi:hypothetical protein